MADIITLKSSKRENTGRRANKKLRGNGKVPGVIYGHGQENLSVEVEGKVLQRSLDNGEHTFSLDLDGQQELVLIREVQWDALTDEILHVDLLRVKKGEQVEMTLPLVYKGDSVGVKEGGVFMPIVQVLTVTCPIGNDPTEIVVDISHLEIGQNLYVKELKLPEGMTALASPETPVAHVAKRRGRMKKTEAAEEKAAEETK